MPYGTGGGGGAGGSIAKDMFFASVIIRDTFTNDNPSRIYQGVACAVGSGSSYDYYQWDASGTGWRDANQIYQGKDGEPGDPSSLIDDSASASDKVYSSEKMENTFPKIDDAAESEGSVYSSKKTQELIDASKPAYSGKANEILKLDENGDLVPSGVMSGKDGSLTVGAGSIDIGPHTISSAGEGIEATNESSGESYSFVFAGQGDDTGPVHRVTGSKAYVDTTLDKSKDLTNHRSKLVAEKNFRLEKDVIIINPVAAQTNVTMTVEDDKGKELWVEGPFDMSIGSYSLHPSTIMDFKVGTYYVTFTSPDGDVTLKGGVSPSHGEDVVYALIVTKDFHDETLANIKAEDKTVRKISVDPTSELVMSVTNDGEVILGTKEIVPEATIDIAFWWSDNAEPTADDILNAMAQEQTDDIISHTDNFATDDLQNKTMTARRDENSFKYAFFAWMADFFNPEPTLVDTGFGGPSTWLSTTRIVDGVTYNVLTVEIKNNSMALENYSLIQEGRK